MRAPDLQQRMLADHRRLEALFTKVMDAFNANAREDTQQLWHELENGLERHLLAEECFLFPRFATVDLTELRALQDDHAMIRARMAELGVGVDLKLVRAEVAQGFLDALRAHAAREDAFLYRWARETLAAKPAIDLLASQPPRPTAPGASAPRVE